MRYLKDAGATVLVTKTTTDPNSTDDDVRSLSDGIVTLELTEQGRRISVPKHRGVGQRDGTHGLEITGDGLEVYTSLGPEAHRREFTGETVPSGIDSFDELLGGGVERGTTTFVTGPTGIGKTTLGTQFLTEAASNGEEALLFTFEESLDTLVHRSEAIGLPVSDLVAEGTLTIEVVEPLALSPEEFATRIRRRVEEGEVSVVMIDGLDGYKVSIRGSEDLLTRKIHALGRYLNNVNVTTLIVDATDQVTGMREATSADVSYLADNIVFLNYLELDGELRKVAGVLKKRVGDFEHTLREFAITEDGIQFGDRLRGVTGVIDGTARLSDPTRGVTSSLLDSEERDAAVETPVRDRRDTTETDRRDTTETDQHNVAETDPPDGPDGEQ